MSDREVETLLRGVVQRTLGRELVSLEAIEAGLGRRRFFRLRLSGGRPLSVVARIESPEDPARRPPGLPPEPPLEPLRRFLEEAGLPVPHRYGADDALGIELLEDAGSRALRDAVGMATPAERRAWYEEVCDLIPRLQRLMAPAERIAAFGRHLNHAFFVYKADFFVRWSLPAALGREPRAAETRVVEDAFRFIAREMAAAPQRLAHRDLQGANVLLRPGTAPGARIVLIDLQGAFLAPPEYDLVCLLRDSYVALEDAEVAHQLARIRPALPDAPAPDTFARRFDLLTLTRKGKDHALGYYHAALRDDPRELRFAPICVRYLQTAAGRVAGLDPCLARLAELIARLPKETLDPGAARPPAPPS